MRLGGGSYDVRETPGAVRAAVAYYCERLGEAPLAADAVRRERPLDILMLTGADGSVGHRLVDTLRPIATQLAGGTVSKLGDHMPGEAPATVAEQFTALFAG